jgi:hypothetical protein
VSASIKRPLQNEEVTTARVQRRPFYCFVCCWGDGKTDFLDALSATEVEHSNDDTVGCANLVVVLDNDAIRKSGAADLRELRFERREPLGFVCGEGGIATKAASWFTGLSWANR